MTVSLWLFRIICVNNVCCHVTTWIRCKLSLASAWLKVSVWFAHGFLVGIKNARTPFGLNAVVLGWFTYTLQFRSQMNELLRTSFLDTAKGLYLRFWLSRYGCVFEFKHFYIRCKFGLKKSICWFSLTFVLIFFNVSGHPQSVRAVRRQNLSGVILDQSKQNVWCYSFHDGCVDHIFFGTSLDPGGIAS